MSAHQWAPLASATLALSLCAFVSPSAQTALQKPNASMDVLDATLGAFWSAERVADADAAARQMQTAGADFDTLFARLHAGPAYLPQKTGRVDMPASDVDGPLDHVVDVPADYTPDRRWPVRIVLHGGVGRERPAAGETPRPLSNRLPGSGRKRSRSKPLGISTVFSGA
jgi:hypothetical protein